MADTVQRDTHVADYSAWGLPAWDFDEFHHVELPRRLNDGVGEQIAWDLVDAAPFAIALTDGRAYTYVAEADTVRLEAGVSDTASCVIELDEHAWRNYLHDLRTPSGLVLAHAVRLLRGNMNVWDDWSPALECMYVGRPIFDIDEPLLDRDGDPLDLHHTFAPDDCPAEIRHFLRTAGYVVIAGAMTHRRDELSEEINRVRDTEQEGGITSWWVENTTTGERFPYRLLFVSERSDLVRSLMDDDPTVRRLVDLADPDLVPLHDRGQGAMTVLKPFKVGDELGDSIAGNLGWHTDCGLGGCSIMCPSVNVGIHLDGADPDSSQLWMIAGTNGRGGHRSRRATKALEPRMVALETEPGDVTVHYSCTQHAGPPPTGDGPRRTLYLPFYSPATMRLLGRHQGFEQILPGYGTGAIPSLDKVAKEVTERV